MKSGLALKLAMFAAALAACVTINVYFPAAAAEKAADQIIGDVIGKSSATVPPEKTPPTGRNIEPPRRAAGPALLVLNQMFGRLIAPAQAAEPNLDVSSAAIRQITDSMKGRHAQLARYYDAGAIGYTADGMVAVRDANLIGLADRNPVRNLLADENKDRTALYAEIAKANGHPEWAAQIRSTFAKRWIANAKGGWYFDDGGGWKQK